MIGAMLYEEEGNFFDLASSLFNKAFVFIQTRIATVSPCIFS